MSKERVIAITVALLAVAVGVVYYHVEIGGRMSEGAGRLFLAVEDGDLARVKEVVRGDPDLVDEEIEHGKTALHFAAWGCFPKGSDSRQDCADIVAYLLSAGADVHAEDDDGRTALHIAAWARNARVCRLLLDSGAEVNAKDDRGFTPLMSGHIVCDSSGILHCPGYNEAGTIRLLKERGGVLDQETMVKILKYNIERAQE